jgi:FkbM family methyltransferase
MNNFNRCIFTNDNNVEILLPFNSDDKFINDHLIVFNQRNNHEVIFRKINTYLINNNFINKNIIDLGAWIGDNSLPWAKNIKGKIFSIDPSEKNLNFINIIKETNGLNNLILIQKAIADKIRIVSTNYELEHCEFKDGPGQKNILETDYLDNLYNKKTIYDICYIHLDVEGYEFKVILGSQQIIEKEQPIITFEQHLHSDDYIGLSEFLSNKGYFVYLINEQLLGCHIDCRNFLAVPKSKFKENLFLDIQNHLNINDLFTKII